MAGTEGPERKIRVLVVDDIPETRESLRKLLYFEKDLEIVGAASGGEEAVREAKSLKPDIVLMDINMPGMDGIAATEAITQQFPYAQVIMMSVQADSDYLRRSMLAGAREFLAKPFGADDLINSIRRVYELGQNRRTSYEETEADDGSSRRRKAKSSRPRGKLIAVFSPKGGTGRSTIAVNLAIALHINGDHRVALVDANLQFGDVAVLLNLQPSHNIADLIPQIKELDAELLSSVLTPHSSGIKAMLAPAQPEMADLVGPEHMKTILQGLLEMFDYVVVDTWASLQDSVLNILDMSDRICLVATPDIPAIKNAKMFFEVIEALQYPEERACLVINMADKKNAIKIKDIEASIKHPVVMRLPTDERSATQAANEGVPVVFGANKKGPLAEGIAGLATCLMGELSPKPEQPEAEVAAEKPAEPQRAGILGRIF